MNLLLNKFTETTLKGFSKARFHRKVFLFSFPRSVMKQQRPNSANPFSDPATQDGFQRCGDQPAPSRRRCGAVVTPITDQCGEPALQAASCTLLPFQGWIWEAADSHSDVTLLRKRVKKVKKHNQCAYPHGQISFRTAVFSFCFSSPAVPDNVCTLLWTC